MRLAIIADYVYFRHGNAWYATIPWDRRFIETFHSAVDHIVLVGRCREVRDVDTSTMHPVDPAYYSVVPMPDWEGLGFVHRLPEIIRKLYKVCRVSDGLYLKLFYVQSVLAYFVNRATFRRPTAALLVGDAAAALTLRDDLVSPGLCRELASRMVYALIRHILRGVDVPATVSERLRERYDTPADTVVANESWLDEEHFCVRMSETAPVPTILFVGRLVPLKGLTDLLQALHRLKAEGFPFRAVIVGDGPMRSKIERQLERLGLADDVELTGWLRPLSGELLDCYRRADIFCLPSYSEGLPLVLIEAMANGAAVVASRVGGIPELVEHEVNGLLVEPGDIDSLASSIKRICREPGLWRRIVINGYETARANTYKAQRGKLGRAIAERLTRATR